MVKNLVEPKELLPLSPPVMEIEAGAPEVLTKPSALLFVSEKLAGA